MKVRSLAFRLTSAATALIVLALSLAAFGLRTIFSEEIERRAAIELGEIVRAIAAQVRIDADGAPVMDVELPDLRFGVPYGGLYWQVSTAGGQTSRSRSLWDLVLFVPDHRPDGARWVIDLDGPNSSRLLSVVQDISVPAATGDASLQVVAALDRSDLTASQQSLFRLLILSLGGLGIILVVAMAAFIRLALRPFDELGRGLRIIHAGGSRSLPGRFPDEVQPIVDDLNQLIQFQDAAIERARTQAGDLAHVLKTPLAVLGAVARQAASRERGDIAGQIQEQVVQMQRQIDRVLARARAGIGSTLGQKAVPVAPVADKVLRTFARLSDSPDIRWDSDIAPGAVFPGEEGDLTEILGNLLDNARKWARHRVRLTAIVTAEGLRLCVEDDGPGIPDDQVLQITRGRRWDETQPGSGFGLAITRDLAEGYQGQLALDRSGLGGLSVIITIPLYERQPL